MSARLDAKVAIVTGATSGIGLAVAERFVDEGARVVLAGRRAELGASIAARLGGGATASFVATDVSDEAQVAALVAHTLERHGRVDVLVNNAGGTEPATVGSVTTIDLDAADRVFAANVRSVVAGMKHVAPAMLAQRSGSIVNIASVAGHKAGYSSSTIYSASKAAVLQLTRSVAMELSEASVRVNSISPGPIVTGIFAKALGSAEGDAADATAAALEGAFAKSQPIPRAGRPLDIADACVFFASDESSFVSGTDLVIDGGLLAGRAWTQHQQGLAGMRAALGGG
jgi:NAD(P)-dependent dehydrogenase (short-subunit alcohol dehydrogenase family)